MAKKKQRPYRRHGFFRPSQSNGPIGNIVVEALNLTANQGLQRLSQETARLFGLAGISPEEQIRLNRSRLFLKKLEAEIAWSEKREADAIVKAEQLKIKQQKQELLNEKLFRLYDLRIEEKELEIERARKNLNNILAQRTELDLHILTEPVAGALEVTANPSGLTGSPEQQEAYKAWLDSFESGKVVLILGKRGSGKSAMGVKIAEYMKVL